MSERSTDRCTNLKCSRREKGESSNGIRGRACLSGGKGKLIKLERRQTYEEEKRWQLTEKSKETTSERTTLT